MQWWLVFLGGGLGAWLRYELGGLAQARLGPSFPWGTFAVNAFGCLAIGLVATWIDERGIAGPAWRTFLVAGVLGGFTTFSSFGLETFRLIEDGRVVAAATNAGASVVVCVAAVAAGVVIGRSG
ncbi:MAG: fluoride efflux transporter CrcB [Proteobacteria bacterium]|nr:MAG: fluoride efflux transporter CrcB [Pseudomonadota bacterium]